MKKTILFFALSAAIINVNAQAKPAVVDPHAGHNHAKEVVKDAATAAVVNAAKDAVMEANKKVMPTMPSAPVIVVTKQGGGIQQPIMNAMTPPPVAPAAPLPETLESKELEFDFGKIPQGKPVTHIFSVTNTGKTPYKLDNVQASCGCTTPSWDREKLLEPGKSMEITVGFTAGAVAPFTKPVTITYNGTQTKMLTIKGEVYGTPATSAPAMEATEIKK
jgi:hypothetical protein